MSDRMTLKMASVDGEQRLVDTETGRYFPVEAIRIDEVRDPLGTRLTIFTFASVMGEEQLLAAGFPPEIRSY
ncbi:MAG: hypothetical protein KGL39_04455 [Patescibacteria group bacterium]|nr:hypothetical protein [Patescibacteria group bacterium]